MSVWRTRGSWEGEKTARTATRKSRDVVEKPLFPCGVSCCFPEAEAGTSLALQRLRLLASTARGPSPGQGSSPCPRGTAKKKKSLTEAEAGASQDGMTSALPGTERSHRTEGGVESPDARLTSPWLSAHRTTVS